MATSSPRALSLIATDRPLRLITTAILAYACFVASLVPYQSVLAVNLFGFSDLAFAAIFVTGATLSLVWAMVLGVMADRTGRRRGGARLAAAAGVIGGALVFATEARWAYLVAHLLFLPIATTLFAQTFTLARLAGSVHPPQVRGSLQTTIRAFFAVPFVVVLPIWAVAFGAGASLIWIYAVCALAAGVTLAIFVFAWPRDGQTVWPDPGSGLTVLAALRELGSPRVMVRVALLGGVSAGIALYLILTGLILTSLPGRDEGDVALFTGFVAGMEVPFMLAMSWPLARLGPVRLIAGAAVLYAVFLVAFPLMGPQPWVWALILPAAMGASVMLTVPIVYMQDLMADRPGAGGSLIALYNLAGQLVGSAIFALGTALGGYALAAWMGAALVALSGIGLALVDRPGRRAP